MNNEQETPEDIQIASEKYAQSTVDTDWGDEAREILMEGIRKDYVQGRIDERRSKEQEMEELLEWIEAAGYATNSDIWENNDKYRETYKKISKRVIDAWKRQKNNKLSK